MPSPKVLVGATEATGAIKFVFPRLSPEAPSCLQRHVDRDRSKCMGIDKGIECSLAAVEVISIDDVDRVERMSLFESCRDDLSRVFDFVFCKGKPFLNLDKRSSGKTCALFAR